MTKRLVPDAVQCYSWNQYDHFRLLSFLLSIILKQLLFIAIDFSIIALLFTFIV